MLVINAGVQTTVQDLGRPGYREWGVPVSGAFDAIAHRLANALLGNAPTDATLEMTLVGGTYQAEQRLALALAGAAADARVERAGAEPRALRIPQSFTLNAGESLRVGGMARGARCYLGVSGGWQTPQVLGSRSTELPIRACATLPCTSATTAARRPAEPLGFDPDDAVIHILDGPDASAVDARDPWAGATYRIQNDASRMGLRLEGPRVELTTDPDRLSGPVCPGTIQIAGGQPIILGIACGTLGGYPHVAQVISADVWRLGQLRPGAEIRFQRISLSAARERDQRERALWDERLRRIALLASDAHE